MKTGERIRCIKQAAELLVQLPLPDIQLILGEHQLQTWEPERFQDHIDYVADRVRSAEDGTLLELLEFLRGDDNSPTTLHENGGPWSGLPVRVFMSHVHDDQDFVLGVKKRLAEIHGIDAFVAHADIHPSMTWRDQIKIALSTCHMFAAFMHEEFHNSQWCDQEVGWAMARNIPIPPVRRIGFDRNAARDGFLEEHQIIGSPPESKSPTSYIAQQIFRALIRESSLKDVALESIVETFFHSPSENYTQNLWRLLSTQPLLSAGQLRRIEQAVATNPIVSGSQVDGTSIPDLVGGLIDKFEPKATVDPWSEEPPF